MVADLHKQPISYIRPEVHEPQDQSTGMRKAEVGDHSPRPSSRWPGGRAGGMIKLVLLLGACVLALSIALRVVAPHLVSSSVVRSAIASSITVWVGHEVSIDDVADIRFWPQPEITLTGITVTRVASGKTEQVGEIERLSARFGLISALLGRPDFSAFRLERPRLRVWRGTDGGLDWSDRGLLSDAVRAAVAESDGVPVGSATTLAEIGSVDIVDGEVALTDVATGATILVSHVNAVVDWQGLAAPLSGQGSFEIADKPVSFTLQTPTPLALIGGALSAVDLSATFAGVSAEVKGRVSLRQVSLQETEVDLRVADVAQTSAALGFRLAGTERWRTASLETTVTRAGDEWRFENVAFAANGSRGDGIVTLHSRPGDRPLLAGTLAMNHLQLDDLLQALSIKVGDRADVRLPSLTQWTDMDLRLSATTASFRDFPLTDLGASLVGRGDMLNLVIGDTRFLGGTISARMSGAGYGFDKGADVSVSMERVDLGTLTSKLVIDGGPTLSGLGSASFNAKLVGTGWQRNIEAMSGKLTIASDNGEILGFDVAGLRRLAADSAYFQLSAAGDESFEYRTLDIAVRFSEGSAEVEKAQIVGTNQALTLTGIIPYSRQALALTGQLSGNPGGSPGLPPLRFFIGGAWSDPVISPVPSVTRSDQ
ncbi:hypothetical protein H6M51_02980 [Rhizobium sp. AQ_MP]|uniref:AsmA family protein n=1 Tax=Rhizobium sp. AQ_MP TaxID=2761536 RepID=UPI00163A8F16|nr:AsmA-like C-terminal region-containing protein [Rhizobium sp. AQ_MP]MBC2771808.1 hypothetical protein [Rhizobium sp. AQ_MP]